MKFVKNNKILEDSNAESAEEAQRRRFDAETRRASNLFSATRIVVSGKTQWFSLRFLCVLCASALKSNPSISERRGI
jgi:hypothetical protein